MAQTLLDAVYGKLILTSRQHMGGEQMFRKQLFSRVSFLIALLLLSFNLAQAQVPHTVLGTVRNDDDAAPPSDQVVFLAYLIDVSDGGVHSETRTNYDTGNAYGNGVMGEGWFELECANFTPFEWANGDSLRLAIANTTYDQLLTCSILLDAAVEPQLVETSHLRPFLQELSVTSSNGQVTVEWSLDPEAPKPDFHLFRSTSEQGPYQKINAQPIAQDHRQIYTYTDYQVCGGVTYWYKLGLAEFSDSLTLFGPAGATVTDVAQENESMGPTTYQLLQNYPNPFNPETTIKYQVPKTSPVSLVIYNLLGQRVRTLVEEIKEPGYYQISWDGLDKRGNQVASGVYFYRLESGPYTKTRKMSLLK